MAALSPNGEGFVATGGGHDADEDSLPIFNVERVQLQFSLSAEFVAAQVANNVLILALSTGRILRIDLDNAADIDDIDLPKRPQETGLIKALFLDPTASHLIINTALGENYYLHTQSRQPKPLSRLRGVAIECIAWNPSGPTASTREILVGTSDGNVYETSIEPTTEFYKREEKYLKSVYRLGDGSPVTGLHVEVGEGRQDTRRVLVASTTKLYHFVGKVGRNAGDGSSSIFTKFFEAERPTVQDGPETVTSAPSALAFTPEPEDERGRDPASEDPFFAWLTIQGVRYGKLTYPSDLSNLGTKVFNGSKLYERTRIPPPAVAGARRRSVREAIKGIALTQWHILCFVEGRVVAINRLNEQVVYDQSVLEPGETALGLFADRKKSTYWLFTSQEIYEIRVEDEDRDIWKILLKEQKYEAALQYARRPEQRDAVATASGDYLIGKKQYLEAASVYGKSNKPFEDVALTLIDSGEYDALRKYLVTKMGTYKKTQTMQRMLIASWLVEVFMAKLNTLDDTITTGAELAENMTASKTRDELAAIQREFGEFVGKHKADLDQRTTYGIISSHGREQELLTYATAINDHGYVLAYWVQRERWRDALDVLKKQTDPAIFYRYSSVLMGHAASEFVDILMRHTELEAHKLIPALLTYAEASREVPLAQHQAARYLHFCTAQLGSRDSGVHNTLVSIYAAHSTPSEQALLNYLSTQSGGSAAAYDADFALRLCIEHRRVQACVHIYTQMGRFAEAVQLALRAGAIEVAGSVAERAGTASQRKRLWLAVARAAIARDGVGAAAELRRRCDLLRVEDLLPLFPDFAAVDDVRDEVCAALAAYARHIDRLAADMDDAAATAASVRADAARLRSARFAVVLPAEPCRVCRRPLLSRQFFVFPSCQHAFHSDCLGNLVLHAARPAARARIRELQATIGRGVQGPRRDRDAAELDALVGKECPLCNDHAIDLVEAAFTEDNDDPDEWAI